MEAGSSASAPSLLFPVFLLLAALVATLTTRRTAHPTNETAVLASLAGRFASPGTAAGTASRDEAELLAALERLRPRLARDATESSETNPTSLDGDWRVTYPTELFFDEATDQPRPGRRVLLYRLAQAAEALAPEGVTIEVTAGPGRSPLGRRPVWPRSAGA
jgi:hypothetical protein